MSNAIEPVRASEPVATTLSPGMPTTPPTAGTSLFDIAMASPRIAVGSDARRTAWLPFLVPAERATSIEAVSVSRTAAVIRDVLAPSGLRDAAQQALIEAGDHCDESPARFAARQDFVAPEERPSCNAPNAQSHVRMSLLARDDGGDLLALDLHVAKLSESRWEAVAFDRADAARGGVFPYAAPPLGMAALSFDARAGAFVLPDVGRMLQLVPATAPQTRHVRLAFAGAVSLVLVCAVGAMLFKALA